MTFQSGTQSLNLTFVVTDFDILNQDGRTDAILGTDMMEDWTVRFDFPRQVVQLSSEPLRNSTFSFMVRHWLPFVPITIQGRQEQALIDLGFNGELLVREAVGLVPEEQKTYTGSAILSVYSQWDTMRVGRMGPIGLFGEELSNSPVLILPDKADHYRVLVGSGFFCRGVLTLDFRSGRGLWERQTARRTTLNYLLPMNYTLVESDGAVHVSNIEVGNETLGLVPGDAIVAVDGKAVDGSVDALTGLLGENNHPTLLIIRNGEYRIVTIDVGPMN